MNDYIHELLELYNNMDLLIPSSSDKYIYHYTSSQGFQGIINDEILRFSDRNFLNDSSEGSYSLDLLCNNLDTICNNYPTLYDKLKEKCNQRKADLLNERFHTYQCSFSIDNDNLSLWNYYTKGDNIKGYNIQFDIQKLINSFVPEENEKEDSFLKPLHGRVIYKEEDQIRILQKIVDKFSEFYAQYPKALDEIVDFVLDKVLLHGKFFKMKSFKVEKEYRIVFDTMLIPDMDKKGIPSKEQFREIQGYFIPYIQKTFSLNAITSVTMSPTLDDKLTYASLNRLFANKNIKINIHKSKIPVRY